MSDNLTPDFDTFAKVYAKGQDQIVSRRLINDVDTPVSAFLKLANDKPYAFLFESVQGGEQRGRYSVLGYAPDLIWRAFGDSCEISENGGDFQPLGDTPIVSLRKLQARSALDIPEALPPMAAGLFGYLGYDTVRQVERLPNINPDPIGTPDAIMTRPTLIAIFDQIAQEIILTTTVRTDSNQDAAKAYKAAQTRLEQAGQDLETAIGTFRSTNVPHVVISPKHGATCEEFSRSVQRAKEYIKAGDIFQVVIGQRLESPLSTSPFALYRSLRRLNPSPFLYYLNFDDHTIVGSSPEILVRLRDGTVTVRPIAGTRPRGKTPALDKSLETELLADKKELAEHLMLLDLGRNDVGRVAKAGTIEVTEEFIVERYSHVMHIVSNVEGEVLDDKDALDALFAGFPAGTVSGAPKVRAMEIIDELENEKRGIYAGAVGYISASGDMDTAIALRTAVVKDGVMHVRAGAGIVMDSDPVSEYEETLAKARALFHAAEHAPYFDRN
ncbi:MAG: anthranilate synthase component I [Acidimicrobiales bacterium]|nr:MAG: anthranilate synthase component I [Acidimicrobiales bacterium]